MGTRLGKITKNKPKVLVSVAGKTILEHSLARLINLGVDEIIINTHYHADQVKDFLKNKYVDQKIRIVYEPKLLGTGGTLLLHLDYLSSDNFIVMHCDNYFEESLQPVLTKHFQSPEKSIMTMFSFITSEPEKCGVIELNSEDIITSFVEKNISAKSNIANGAIYIFKPKIREFIRNLEFEIKDLSKDLLPLLVGHSTAYISNGFFFDIGTAQNLSEARKVLGTING